MRNNHRATKLILAGAATAALAVLALQAPADGAATRSAFPAGAPAEAAEAADYASTVFHDAWDYSNSSDLILDGGPTKNLGSKKISGGALVFTVNGSGYFSPLWGGYPGSLPLGRDGSISANDINASTYKKLRFYAYSSRPLSTAITWFTQPKQKGQGGQTVALQPGWHEYDLVLKNNPKLFHGGGAAWKGLIKGMRFAFNAKAKTKVEFDFIRAYAENRGPSTLSWQSPDPAVPASLYWTRSSSPLQTTAHLGGGPVCNPDLAKTSGFCTPALATGGPATVDVSGYPADTVFYAVTASGETSTPLHIAARPDPTVTAPAAAGCGVGGKQSAPIKDYTFKHGRNYVLKTGNAGAKSYAGGYFSATNAKPVRNDPWVQIRLPKGGINGKAWRYLTVTEGYSGPFDLGSKAGGGTLGRIVWRVAGKSAATASQTNDIVTYSGKQTIALDMGIAAAKLTEPEAKTRYAFAAQHNVTMLRWDPNEDPGARRWHLYQLTLGEMCAVKPGQAYNVTWSDKAFQPGATAQIIAFKGTPTHVLLKKTLATGVRETGASGNKLHVTRAMLGSGNWSILVKVTNAAGTTNAYSATPIKRS